MVGTFVGKRYLSLMGNLGFICRRHKYIPNGWAFITSWFLQENGEHFKAYRGVLLDGDHLHYYVAVPMG